MKKKKKKEKESYTKSTGAFPYWKDQQPHQWPIPQPSPFFIVESSAIRPEDKSSLRKRNNSFHQLAGRMHRRLRSVHKNWSRGIECYSVRCPAWRTFPTRLLNAHQVYRYTTRWKGPHRWISSRLFLGKHAGAYEVGVQSIFFHIYKIANSRGWE